MFLKLYHDAQGQPDVEVYISEYGYPDYFDKISKDADDVVKTLTEIHQFAHMTMADVVKRSELGASRFARYFDIPLRTLHNWYYGKRPCPDYIKLMTAELLGIIKI